MRQRGRSDLLTCIGMLSRTDSAFPIERPAALLQISADGEKILFNRVGEE